MDKWRGSIGLAVAICLIAVLVYDQYRNGPAPVESAGTAASGPALELPLADDGSGADDTTAAGTPSPAAEPQADKSVAPSTETAASAEAPAAGPPPAAAASDTGNPTNPATGKAAPPPAASAAAPAAAPPAEAEAPAKTAAAEPAAGEPPAPEPSAPSVSAAPAGSEPAVNPPAAATPSGALPSFDVVRVEPTGETVIAGQAEPNAEVEILDGNAPLAKAEANERGEWAMALDRPLPPGSHDLAIRTTTEDRKTVTLSDQRVAVSVPGGGSKDVLVVINTPDAASRVVEAGGGEGTSAPTSATPPAEAAASSAPSTGSPPAGPAPAAVASVEAPSAEAAPAPPPSAAGGAAATATAAVEAPAAQAPSPEAPAPTSGAGQPQTAAAPEPSAAPATGTSGAASAVASSEAAAPAASAPASPEAPSVPAPAVAVTAVEADTDGSLFIAGTASTPDSVRVYLDDAFIGAAAPTEGGTWLLQARRDLPAGQYKVRADQVDKGGNVIVRAEVPFEREVAVAQLKPEGSAAGTSGTEASGTLPNPQTVIIKQGDNLWRLSRSMYGRGMRWSTIYTANKDQIRNPRWIYPGQVFVVPAGDTTWKK